MRSKKQEARSKKIWGRGMTLVEVLATVLLIGIVLPVVMEGISVTTQMAGLARERNEASALAEAKLNELLATGDWQSGNLSGDFGADNPGFTWQAAVTDWDELNTREVDVSVMWMGRTTQREVTVSTVVYTPEGTQ